VTDGPCPAPGCYGGETRHGLCDACGGTGSAAVAAQLAREDRVAEAEARREGVAAEWRDKRDPSGM